MIESKTLEGDCIEVEVLIVPIVPPPMANPVDAMMVQRRLSIVISLALAPRPMPIHLPKFSKI